MKLMVLLSILGVLVCALVALADERERRWRDARTQARLQRRAKKVRL